LEKRRLQASKQKVEPQMDEKEGKREICFKRGPSANPYAKITLKDRRQGVKERRRLYTFIANDRRGGMADRRKRPV
jgi:hypothetical protein